MTTTTCRCAEAASRSYPTQREGINDGRTKLLVDAVEIARADERRIVLLRCACGRAWAEGLWSVGHMDIYYVFPVPEGVDAIVWFETADTLPYHRDGPLGKP